MKDISLAKTNAQGEYLYNKVQDIAYDDIFSKYMFYPKVRTFIFLSSNFSKNCDGEILIFYDSEICITVFEFFQFLSLFRPAWYTDEKKKRGKKIVKRKLTVANQNLSRLAEGSRLFW